MKTFDDKKQLHSCHLAGFAAMLAMKAPDSCLASAGRDTNRSAFGRSAK